MRGKGSERGKEEAFISKGSISESSVNCYQNPAPQGYYRYPKGRMKF